MKVIMKKEIPTPKEIMNYLNERVIGQYEAKKRLSVAVYNHYKRVMSNVYDIGNDGDFKDIEIDKSNVMLMGGTGTGKTFLIRSIAKMLGVPCHVHDCTKLTAAGYVGEDVENVLTGLLQAADYDVEKAEVGIVCLDEIDKLAKKGDNISITRDVSGECVQQELLKIVEGDVVRIMPQGKRKDPRVPMISIDTTNILFIAMGAFVGLDQIVAERTRAKTAQIGFNRSEQCEEDNEDANLLRNVTSTDLKKFGIIPELIGRFPIITSTNPLNKEELVRIIKEPNNSILKQYQKLAYIDRKKLEFTDGAIDIVAEIAVVTETGARGLRNILETILNDFMFNSCDSRKRKLVVDRDYCLKSLDSTLDRGTREKLKEVLAA
ncbi:MAG: ATP-dependent Clp protease ATP-binding subunit ClpX [Bacteroidales bacterium]|nr:ATP-dependent Clp protease ATP-binding subunit ClpX [Bacteroidales bacterium]